MVEEHDAELPAASTPVNETADGPNGKIDPFPRLEREAVTDTDPQLSVTVGRG